MNKIIERHKDMFSESFELEIKEDLSIVIDKDITTFKTELDLFKRLLWEIDNGEPNLWNEEYKEIETELKDIFGKEILKQDIKIKLLDKNNDRYEEEFPYMIYINGNEFDTTSNKEKVDYEYIYNEWFDFDREIEWKENNE